MFVHIAFKSYEYNAIVLTTKALNLMLSLKFED